MFIIVLDVFSTKVKMCQYQMSKRCFALFDSCVLWSGNGFGTETSPGWFSRLSC